MTLIFLAFVIGALILDLGVFNRKSHIITTKEAGLWTGIWLCVALAFSAIVYLAFDNGWTSNPTALTPMDAVLKYITGYLIELSLSVDNIFVIALIFSAFAIPPIYQHRVLFYGILGAIVFRAIMIVFGVVLIQKFSWIIYVFGGFLLITALRMLFNQNQNYDPKNSKIFHWIGKLFPMTDTIEQERFFIRKKGVRYATPLFVALIIIEFTDIFFAVDSIPAILAITADPFLVFSSNILAIMGLRSLYFLISGMLEKFKYMSYSLVVILAFVGLKMILSHHVNFPEWISLTVIALSLLIGAIASIRATKIE